MNHIVAALRPCAHENSLGHPQPPVSPQPAKRPQRPRAQPVPAAGSHAQESPACGDASPAVRQGPNPLAVTRGRWANATSTRHLSRVVATQRSDRGGCARIAATAAAIRTEASAGRGRRSAIGKVIALTPAPSPRTPGGGSATRSSPATRSASIRHGPLTEPPMAKATRVGVSASGATPAAGPSGGARRRGPAAGPGGGPQRRRGRETRQRHDPHPGHAFTSVSTNARCAAPAFTTLCSTPAARW